MSHAQHVPVCCPNCGAEMLTGRLKDASEFVYVESMCSRENSTLEALICSVCGHVELHASHPERLARHDIPEEEMGISSRADDDSSYQSA